MVSRVAHLAVVGGAAARKTHGAGSYGREYKGDAWGDSGGLCGGVGGGCVDLSLLNGLCPEATGRFAMPFEVLFLMRAPG